MTTRIDLPGGGWAEIKDPDELTNRERQLARRHLMAAQRQTAAKLRALGITTEAVLAGLPPEVEERANEVTTSEDLDLIDRAQAAMIVVYLDRWSLERPLPTMDDVDDLPGPVFDALAKATTKLGDGSLDTSVEGAGDEKSPTVPSGG